MSQSKFWNMTKNSAKNSGEITIYGYISEYDWWDEDVTPQQFNEDLASLGDVDELNIRINSGGGSVTAGVAIHSMLKRHKAKVTVYVDGWAASIASIIAMAGDRIVMGKGSMMMIHNPSSGAWGEAKDLRKQADVLDQVRESLLDVYETRTGKSRDELTELLDAETWFTASQAVENGFADEVEDSLPVVASMRNGKAFFNGVAFDFSKFKNAPKLPEAKPHTGGVVQGRHAALENEMIIPLSMLKKEGQNTMDLKELQAKYPELYNQVLNAGVEQERARIQAIDALNFPGSDEMKNKAKYETYADAGATAIEILNAQAVKGKAHQANAKNDSDNSGMNDVEQSEPNGRNSSEDQGEDIANRIAGMINKKRGVK